ncbi:inositol monophosphatase family protein [Streptococcus hillyeri]|uniref:Inositol monophosphatase family protein n=1 Tax=Streptococcus hillyeri TaxID=2282420 RepID=A0A3L9DY37_9STRE|nr:inositol monophosphatase family protein [Streptococcus hillyeri]RLY04817.1 inositol monophosphatase family protein [Streptococcus hillyeri]
MESKFTFAQNVIKEAGKLLLQQMEDIFDITVKSTNDDIVTSVDVAIQTFLMQKITVSYPKDHFLAEESDNQQAISDGNVWVIDPIDGTLNFVTQKSDFAIMLAYFEQGVGQFGLIYDVMADKLYAGGGIFPVTCNGRELPVFDGRPLNQSLVACNTGMIVQNDHNILAVLQNALGIRNYGCAGLSMAKVLNNQLWAYFSNVYPWDYAAASILGQSLGYELLTLDGQTVDFISREKVVFLPRQYKADVLHLLNKNEQNWA